MAGMRGSSGASGIAGSSLASVHFFFFARSKVKTLHERIPLAGFSKLPSIPQIAKVTGTGCLLCGHGAFGEACATGAGPVGPGLCCRGVPPALPLAPA